MSLEKADSVPKLVGNNKLNATHEIHIFLDPIMQADDPRYDQIVGEYKGAVTLWNTNRPANSAEAIYGAMKAPVLTLVFRDGKGELPLTVCQSARYVYCNNMQTVLEEAKADQRFFEWVGFRVLRVKIEASAEGVKGVPFAQEEADRFPHLYFEFHCKVEHIDQTTPALITDKEEQELRALADQLSVQFERPIPLSYNREKNEDNKDNGGCQRFLNVRFNGGYADIKPKVKAIKAALVGPSYRVPKIIKEFVWYDTSKAMDHGWIDYSPAEFAALQSRIKA